MSVVMRFRTTLFDVTKERPNPINPIAGESLLGWLGDRLPPELRLTPPAPEDWGWYSLLRRDGREYLVGASSDPADTDDEQGAREWILQIEPRRSLKERLLGRGRIEPGDPCIEAIRAIIRSEPAFSGVTEDP